MSNPSDSVIERFSSIVWHDSKLLGVNIYREGSEEVVKIFLNLLGEKGTLTPAQLLFRSSAYVELGMDLHGKQACSDDIADAECLVGSDWQRALLERNPFEHGALSVKDPFAYLEGYLHFRIRLISPGGTINILARDFRLEMPREAP